jgi:hypothetical protein
MSDEIVLQCDHRGHRTEIRAKHGESGNSLNAEQCDTCKVVLIGGVVAHDALVTHDEDKHLLGA